GGYRQKVVPSGPPKLCLNRVLKYCPLILPNHCGTLLFLRAPGGSHSFRLEDQSIRMEVVSTEVGSTSLSASCRRRLRSSPGVGGSASSDGSDGGSSTSASDGRSPASRDGDVAGSSGAESAASTVSGAAGEFSMVPMNA